jgi:predicted nucleic acid-binding protein
VTDVVVDSGPLSMWAEADRRVLAILEATQRSGGIAFVPTVCLVESLTGRQRDAALNRVLKGARLVPLDEAGARRAAERRAVVDGDDVADPVVVATAARLTAVVVTTDPSDIGDLAAAAAPTVAVVDPRSHPGV